MTEQPKILKDLKVYFTLEGGIAVKYLLEQLKNDKIIKEESSLSFFNEVKETYVYTLTVPANSEEISAHNQIETKYIQNDTVIFALLRSE